MSSLRTILLLTALASSCDAFATSATMRTATVTTKLPSTMQPSPDDFYFADDKSVLTPVESVASKKKNAPPLALQKKKPAVHSTDGPLAPLVLWLKDLLGDNQLNQLRAKSISLHSDVIKSFVDTSDSQLGQSVIAQLFQIADADRNGVIDKDELRDALHTLGFEWLQDKQINGILQRSDTNENGTIELEEFKMAVPKTLKTNLVKLAKQNGGALGLLA